MGDCEMKAPNKRSPLNTISEDLGQFRKGLVRLVVDDVYLYLTDNWKDVRDFLKIIRARGFIEALVIRKQVFAVDRSMVEMIQTAQQDLVQVKKDIQAALTKQESVRPLLCRRDKLRGRIGALAQTHQALRAALKSDPKCLGVDKRDKDLWSYVQLASQAPKKTKAPKVVATTVGAGGKTTPSSPTKSGKPPSSKASKQMTGGKSSPQAHGDERALDALSGTKAGGEDDCHTVKPQLTTKSSGETHWCIRDGVGKIKFENTAKDEAEAQSQSDIAAVMYQLHANQMTWLDEGVELGLNIIGIQDKDWDSGVGLDTLQYRWIIWPCAFFTSGDTSVVEESLIYKGTATNPTDMVKDVLEAQALILARVEAHLNVRTP